MTRRDALFAGGGVLAAGLVSLVLVVAVLARQAPSDRSIVVGRQPVPTPPPASVLERRIPAQFRALLSPLLPLERNLTDAGREAATLLLVVLASGGSLVLGGGQIARIRAATTGDAREHLRVLGIGMGVLIALASVLFLAVFVLLRGVIALTPESIPLGLQTILSTLAVVLLVVGVAALLGFTATAARIGSWLFGLRPWRSFGERVPPALATLVAVALMFLLTQTPILGRLMAAVLLAYSLGAFVRARLAPAPARTSAAGS